MTDDSISGSTLEELRGHLPRGWSTATLGEVTAERVAQNGPLGEETFTYLDISSVDNRAKRIQEPKILAVSQAPSRARQNVEPGDVLVSMTRPNLNAVAIVPESLGGTVCSTGFHVLRAVGADPRWLFAAVQDPSFVAAMSDLVQGALYPAVRPRDIQQYEIPIPPLPEQRRIVAEIETQFTRLDAAVAALERARANLKRYRAAVLIAAVSGQLLPTEADVAEAESRIPSLGIDHFEQIAEHRRAEWNRHRDIKGSVRGSYPEPSSQQSPAPNSLPRGWHSTTIDHLAVVVRGASPRPAGDPKYFDGTIPWITVGSLTKDSTPYLREVREFVTEEWS